MKKKDEKREPGRPKEMDGEVITVGLRMTRAQREKLAKLGGAAWVREQIEGARTPD